jgi:N-methylhydantoinase A
MAKSGVRVAVDIGGTFTDVVVLDGNGAVRTLKLPSTTGDYSRGIVDGIRSLAEAAVWPVDAIADIVHGTTAATNAVLEGTGARTGLVTTKGFRDVLELGRMRRPVLYDLFWEKPRPLVHRSMRLEVLERMSADGREVVPVDIPSVRRTARRLAASGADSVAVCLINSYRNPAHEQSVGAILSEELPGIPVSLSSEVLPEVDEYERTSTTTINAYLRPVIESYVGSLLDRLDQMGIRCPVLIMQSSGGLMSARGASERPAYVVESGPAAGAIGSSFVAQELGLANAITFDMGGTTAKASIIEEGRLRIAHESEIGAGISIGTRLQSGGGYVLRVPAIDLAEVGAGGGSIVSVDQGGALKVGPQSAGALPGPICYGLGGRQLTVTDANLVLGYLNPDRLAGGAVALDPLAARHAVQEQVADRLRLGLYEAAYGVHVVANANMTRAINAVSTERGRDPRQFTLIAFGGSGPVHAAAMARALGIGRVLIPLIPGLFSAFGLLVADVERRAVRTCNVPLVPESTERVEGMFSELETEAAEALRREGFRASAFQRSADLRYAGQAHALLVDIPTPSRDVAEIRELFDREHQQTYGRKDEVDVEIVNLRATARAGVSKPSLAALRIDGVSASSGRPTTRMAYFTSGLTPTSVLTTREQLGVESWNGPLIIEEYDSTIVVPPGTTAHLDPAGNVLIDTFPSEPG